MPPAPPGTLMRHMRTASGVEKLHSFEQLWSDSPFTASSMLSERLNNIVSVLLMLREQHEQNTLLLLENNQNDDVDDKAGATTLGQQALLSASTTMSVLVALDEDELVGHVSDEIEAINSFASAAGRIAMDPVRDCFMRADKALSSAEKKVARAVTKMEKKRRMEAASTEEEEK